MCVRACVWERKKECERVFEDVKKIPFSNDKQTFSKTADRKISILVLRGTLNHIQGGGGGGCQNVME